VQAVDIAAGVVENCSRRSCAESRRTGGTVVVYQDPLRLIVYIFDNFSDSSIVFLTVIVSVVDDMCNYAFLCLFTLWYNDNDVLFCKVSLPPQQLGFCCYSLNSLHVTTVVI